MSMEYLSVNKGNGQAYGYVMYRVTIPSVSKKVTITKLKDYGIVSIYCNNLYIASTCMYMYMFIVVNNFMFYVIKVGMARKDNNND